MFKASRCESWRTKRGGSWDMVGVFWGKIHGDEKHMSRESIVSNLGEFDRTE
ncbi:hypothetical protein MtrunA17_Chr8g0338401 [Medicago truncatula]|uniref:Uncharacterized protein n=1 Tax=Medicago truncatula TaxID=3880 RepID=A0A396GCD4_MEDTR|nr:hypothetical protein MtrunA17_Chr8g0338401 [Medicago truncatula]